MKRLKFKNNFENSKLTEKDALELGRKIKKSMWEKKYKK